MIQLLREAIKITLGHSKIMTQLSLSDLNSCVPPIFGFLDYTPNRTRRKVGNSFALLKNLSLPIGISRSTPSTAWDF